MKKIQSVRYIVQNAFRRARFAHLPAKSGLVELVGASGIGKSYLVGESLQYITYPMSSGRPSETIPRDLDAREEAIYCELYRATLMRVLGGSSLLSEKLDMARYYAGVIGGDIAIKRNISRRYFLMDEWLCHLYYDILTSLCEEDLRAVLGYRGIVFLYADSDLVVERIRKRQQTLGIVRPRHRLMSDQELKEATDARQAAYRKLRERIEKIALPTTELDAGADLDGNCRAIARFMDSVAVGRS